MARTALRLGAALALTGLAAAPPALAQIAPASSDPAAARPMIARAPARSTTPLKVVTPAFRNGEDIPFDNTQYRGDVFPGLFWTAGPAGTASYAIVMQDTEVLLGGAPILHWTLFNIPAHVTNLAPGMTAPPAGSSYGPDYMGPSHAYLGPRTPPGPKHHYHIQVFALDTTVPAAAASDFGVLTAALEGHVLASGEVVGLGSADPTAAPPTHSN